MRMRRPSRRVLVVSSAALFALALVIALQPIASADPRKGRWRWWWRPGGQASQPAQPTPTATAVPTPTAPGTPTSHASHGPGTGTGAGPRYDPARIPAGHAGVGVRDIATTGEKPTADPDGIGAFRTVCEYSHMRADDPIVKPGQPGASHLHTFWGNTTTDANSTAGSLLARGNGTCRGGIVNRSGYWVPSVIDTRTGTPLAPDLIHVYYKSGYGGIRPNQIEAIPTGLRMVAGNAAASGPQDFMGWSCWSGGGKFSSIPACGVGDHVSMDVEFPQCWNGTDLDSADHKSHLAYPRNGACPASHPRAIPVISYHVLFRVKDGTSTSAWRLSSDTYDTGKPGGFSVHGDWLGAWDQEILDTWTRLCVRTPGSCGSHMIGDGRAMRMVPGEED
jgi:hypothetical protein